MVERATGLGCSKADHQAAEKLLYWVRSGSLDAVDVLRAIVAGSNPSEAALNARVLSVLHWLCLAGGPAFLPSAAWSGSARKPGPGVRVCHDVLSSFGHDDAGDVLHDDNRVRRMRVGELGLPEDALEKCRFGNVSVAAAAVETYAIALGRKLVFHSRYSDVEGSFSLDRFFRALHTENDADVNRKDVNEERYMVIVSRVSLSEMALLTRALVVAAQRLADADIAGDIVGIVMGDAANACVFTEYLRGKVRDGDAMDTREEREWLARKLRAVRERGGEEWRIVRRFVDAGVYKAIVEGDRIVRPESRHRREVVCKFTTFEALHRALRPPMVVKR